MVMHDVAANFAPHFAPSPAYVAQWIERRFPKPLVCKTKEDLTSQLQNYESVTPCKVIPVEQFVSPPNQFLC